MKLSIDEVTELAMAIMDAHSIGADMDAGYDAGEFSGPTHSRMEQDEITELVEKHGFTFSQIMNHLNEMANREESE
jgi:hypothetical protein